MEREPFDLDAYVQRITTGPCFICRIVANDPAYPHHVIYADDAALVFLNKYPTLAGYTLVAPRQHREHVTGDFSLTEYLVLQQLVYQVAEALRRSVPTERIYIVSLGSQQANAHVHWHVAALPPGVPFRQQQFEALRLHTGILPLAEDAMHDLAQAIRGHLDTIRAEG
jgi:ATP adenylyltransferase